MFQNRPPTWAIVGLALIALLLVGSIVRSDAWSQGYIAGLLTNSTEGARVAPYLSHGTGYGMHRGGFGGFFGIFFCFGFILLLFAALGGLFRFWRWRGPNFQYGPWWQKPRHHDAPPPGGPTPPTPDEPQRTTWTNL